jgi:hypothetical protein
MTRQPNADDVAAGRCVDTPTLFARGGGPSPSPRVFSLIWSVPADLGVEADLGAESLSAVAANVHLQPVAG